jgi:hypothetical protein
MSARSPLRDGHGRGLRSADARTNAFKETAMDDKGLKRVWWLGLLIDHLRPIRVPLLVVAFGAVLALGVDQVAELLLIVVQAGSPARAFVLLLIACAAAAVAIWYQGRNAFRMHFPRWPSLQDPRGRWLRAWLPRLLGASVPVLVAAGCWVAVGDIESTRNADLSVWRALALLVLAVLLVLGFVTRRKLFNAVSVRVGLPPLPASPHSERSVSGFAGLGRAPKRVLIAVALLNVLLTLLIVWRPTLIDGFGPLAILLLGGAFFCITGGFITLLSDRRGIPVLSLLALLAAGLHAARLNDNHLVRLSESMSTHAVSGLAAGGDRAALPTFEDYRDAWLAERCADAPACPIVLVSSEGGGIRAAAWTALVLGQLEASGQGKVIDRIFAMSGVSGGSLGIATVAALHRRHPAEGSAGWVHDRAEAFLTRDFLAPTLANTLFVDFTQRLLPGAWFDDRGRALTLSWEKNFATSAGLAEGEINAFAQPMAALYRRDGRSDTRVPALFLNSTVVQTGERMVQHPFRSLPSHGDWFAARDIADFPTADLPLGEAVLNSARFSYVSPAGTLVDAAGQPALQLVDGGYFENSGATTLMDIIASLRTSAWADRLQLRVLHISNDPLIEPFAPASAIADEFCIQNLTPAGASAVALSGEVTAPVIGLLSTREARGGYARQALSASLGEDDLLWHFRLCPGEYLLPLGWTISTPVVREMQRQLLERYQLTPLADAMLSPLARDSRTDP